MLKKIAVASLLAALLVVSLCACGQQGGSANSSAASASQGSVASESPQPGLSSSAASGASQSEAATSSSGQIADFLAQNATHNFATLNDAFEAPGNALSSYYIDDRYVFCFYDGDACVRVEAVIPEGMAEKLAAAGDDLDQVIELLAPLPISRESTWQGPSQSEVDAFLGKTGEQLAAEGFTFAAIAGGDGETLCAAARSPYVYLIAFDGVAETDSPSDAVWGLKVKSISIQDFTYDVYQG